MGGGISEEVGEKHKKKLDESILSTNKAMFAAPVRIHVRACHTANEILTLVNSYDIAITLRQLFYRLYLRA